MRTENFGPPFAVLSASIKGLSKSHNDRRAELLREEIKERALEFIPAEGRFENVQEPSNIVFASLNSALELARMFEQNYILYANEYREVALVNVRSGKGRYIGLWKGSSIPPFSNQDYTFVPELNTYYRVEKDH